jgi:hypothetical protein
LKGAGDLRNSHLDIKLRKKKLEEKTKQDQVKIAALESDKKALKQVLNPLID